MQRDEKTVLMNLAASPGTTNGSQPSSGRLPALDGPLDLAALTGALRTVILFTLTDSFGLVPEESMWAGYHIHPDRILAPLVGKHPLTVPVAVRREMTADHPYTQALDNLETRDDRNATAAYDPRVIHADINDWVAVIMQMVTTCYPLRPLEESSMHGQLVGVLRELGVGDRTNPRAARYLPNDVRHRLANRTN